MLNAHVHAGGVNNRSVFSLERGAAVTRYLTDARDPPPDKLNEQNDP